MLVWLIFLDRLNGHLKVKFISVPISFISTFHFLSILRCATVLNNLYQLLYLWGFGVCECVKDVQLIVNFIIFTHKFCSNPSRLIYKIIWVKVFKNGPSRIFGRQPLKFKGCLPQIQYNVICDILLDHPPNLCIFKSSTNDK